MSETLHTRRSFLKTSFLGGAFAWTVPAFLEQTFLALDAQAAHSALQTATGRDHPILVIVQLAGGNDGLNTVVPFSDDAYFRARPRLALPAKSLLRINDELALHPSLPGLRGLFDEGRAAILSGVGYPNPNRSHFRSTDIWQTASDADVVKDHGWIGRYFDACCAGEDATTGISITGVEPLAFQGVDSRSIAFANPNRMTPPPEEMMQMMESADAMHSMMEGDSSLLEEGQEGGSIEMVAGGSLAEGDESNACNLDFLRRTALDAQLSSQRIREITERVSPSVSFPATQLGSSLETIARLIAGSMPTRVYYASQGGYDTHGNQLGAHERLLGHLDNALTAFVRELDAQGNLDRVVIMTFSEFGRRVAENANQGTDHGAAAPLFVLGGGIQPGLFGKQPSLDTLDRGDLIHHLDFRSVYATILERWLHAPATQILGRKFPDIPFLA